VLNFALEKAHGTYICRINQDDRMLPHRMDRQVAYLQKNSKVVAVGSHITHFFDDGSKEVVKFLKTDREIREIWHIVGPFADPSVMYRRETALAVGGYDQTFWPVDDTHMWYRMGTKGKLANIPETLVDVRWHAKAGSVYHFRKMAWQIYRVRRWAHVHIQPGTIWHQMFWVAQLTAGMVLSPTMNWKIYRKIKKLIAWYEEKKYHAKKHVSGISNLRLYFN